MERVFAALIYAALLFAACVNKMHLSRPYTDKMANLQLKWLFPRVFAPASGQITLRVAIFVHADINLRGKPRLWKHELCS